MPRTKSDDPEPVVRIITVEVSLHEKVESDTYGAGKELVNATTKIVLPVPDAGAITYLIDGQVRAILDTAGRAGISTDPGKTLEDTAAPDIPDADDDGIAEGTELDAIDAVVIGGVPGH